jgi:hypothetical protein
MLGSGTDGSIYFFFTLFLFWLELGRRIELALA